MNRLQQAYTRLFFCQIWADCFASSCTAKHLFLCKKNRFVAPPWGIWLRTHFWGIEREEENPAPCGNQTLDLKSFALQACALPLYYNCCPMLAQLLPPNQPPENLVQSLLSRFQFESNQSGFLQTRWWITWIWIIKVSETSFNQRNAQEEKTAS